jgi:hypothetical protein
MGGAMNTTSLQEKVAMCLRIASRLSWNNPARVQLTELAERYYRQAKEQELESLLPDRAAKSTAA